MDEAKSGSERTRETLKKKADERKLIREEASEKYKKFVERVDRAREDDVAEANLRTLVA